MARPAFRLTANRKDGEEITFKDYQGNKQTKRYAPVGALFPTKSGNGFNLTLDRKVTLDPEEYWFTMFPVEDRNEDEDERPRKKGKPAKKQRQEEPEDGDESSDDEELSF
jgi:hypothetical protein